jgi:hypothetical protein
MSLFHEEHPSLESYWRSIILFGRNSASYKFALAKSLLQFSQQGKTFVGLEELAGPFSLHIAEHMKGAKRQGTSGSSKFLDACRRFNSGELSSDELQEITIRLGFNNVIDAFHIVNQGELPLRFFEDNRTSAKQGITLTDDLLNLKASPQFRSFPLETEARWRLVETAWALSLNTRMLEVQYNVSTESLFVRGNNLRRVDVTSCRDALNGYQKGKCFYCFADICVVPGTKNLADIDHFFPHTLVWSYELCNLDGVWNLVLACASCNRGSDGKFARVAEVKFLERLHKRNSFLIDSHHPLRETLILQTGRTEQERRQFLRDHDRIAINLLIHRWRPNYEFEAAF